MMPELRFDPSKAVTFDLTQGLVRLEGAAPSSVLVPADALAALVAAAGADAAATFARALGATMGRRMVARLEGSATAAPVDAVVEHLAGELAVSGLGSVSLERWGRAAVLVVDQSPFGGAGDALLEAILAAAIAEAAGRPVVAALLGREGQRVRFLLGGRAGADRVRAWMAEGASWGDAIVRLHAPAAAEAAPLRGDS